MAMQPVVRSPSRVDLDGFPRIGYLAIRALREAGYGNLRQLAGVPRHRLADLENVGPKSLALIEASLRQHRLSLGPAAVRRP